MLQALRGISLGDVQELQGLAWLGTAYTGEVPLEQKWYRA